ncbi:MAG: glycoside hydrolase family 28 protein [Comamonadaceae bacterium]|nr:glycoside hydrolase family 28 protein [Comamonadaceae bacterium]
MALPEQFALARRSFVVGSLGIGASALLGSMLTACGGGDGDPEAIAWNGTMLAILDRITVPSFPARDFPITDFGAIAGATVGDAIVVANTTAINKAIIACNLAGGGRVVVPSGTFMTGAIRLKSNVNLHLPNADSVLLFDTDPAKYPNVLTRWEGNDLYNYSPLVYAYRETNIAITGKGTLDGQAGINASNPNNKQGNPSAWWWWKGGSQSNPQFGCAKDNSTFADSAGYPCLPNQSADSLLLKSQGAVPGNVPVSQRVYGIDASGTQHYLRPPLVGPYGCENVLIEGVTLTRSPFWQLHPLFCKSVTVRNATMSSLGTNNDGCDPEACVDVLIEGCTFNTGDDCIAIKAGRGTDGFAPPPGMPADAIAPWVRYPNYPNQCASAATAPGACAAATRNIIIRNCVMASGHGGVTLGSEMSGGIENVFVENIQMNSSELDIALRFKTNTRRGGVMRNYYARNIQVPNGVSANNGVITIDYFYRADASDDPAESGPYRPFTDQIYISNLTVGRGTKAGTKAFNIRGFAMDSPSPLPPNYVANTPRAGVAGSVGVNDPVGVVRVRNSTFNVSTAADVVQNVDLRLDNVTINRS